MQNREKKGDRELFGRKESVEPVLNAISIFIVCYWVYTGAMGQSEAEGSISRWTQHALVLQAWNSSLPQRI
ncbi:hypothetical protein J6590_104574, partial [Homalodisca vitripennis]